MIFQFSRPLPGEGAGRRRGVSRRIRGAAARALRAQNAPPMLLGPPLRLLPRVNGRFRYRLTLRCENTKPLRQLIAWQLQRFRKNKAYSAVHVSADCNPYDV